MSTDTSGMDSDSQLLANEARSLVSQLYDPVNAGNPAKINLIQEHLQVLQKGPHAWIIANDLLGSDNTGLRFFGALTFTVKINQDWKHLSEDEIRELLGRLIDHYVFLVNAGEQPLVIRKLASSLATIFTKPKTPWTRALLNLAASIANGKYISEEQCQSFSLEDAVLPVLSETQLLSLLYFSSILGEELDRFNTEMSRTGDEKRISENIDNAFHIVEFVLRRVLQQESSGVLGSGTAPGIEAINTYHAWMSLRDSLVGSSVRETMGQLRSATSCIIQSLKVSDLYKAAAQALLEHLDWRDDVFHGDLVNSILEYITSDPGTSHVAALMDGDFDDEHITFLDLLLAYATFTQKELLTEHLTPPHEKVHSLLHMLLKAPGYPGVDDSAAQVVIEWWTEMADDLQDMLEDSQGQPAFELGTRNLARASLDCFQKLMCPDPETLQEWTDEDRNGFNSFRRDGADFLLAAYPLLGVELIQVFQQQAISSSTNQDWRTFEAAAFCLAQLSDAVDENEHADEFLNAIFFTDEFSRLCGGAVEIPNKARQTLVDMLGKYEAYFERTQVLLPRVLTFLFASLDIASCAPTASKSISNLCQSCCNSLTVELPAFMDQFESFRFKPTATAMTMERVLEGIAAIIHALVSDEEKAQFLERILRFYQEQAQLAKDEANRGITEAACTRGQLVLRCVASIGKGLREDDVVDLSDENNGDPYPPTFWNTGEGAMSQNLIIQCMQLLIEDFPFDIAIIEAACDILKAGYTEKAGPYVLPPMVTVNFIKSIPPGSAGSDTVMCTASAFLASHSAHPRRIQGEVAALITHVYEAFCSMHERPDSYDPEVANSGIDFLTRLLPKYYFVLFSLTSSPPETSQSSAGSGMPQRPAVLEGILNFTLLALQAPEPLPLRSASQFWASVFSLPVINPNQPNPVQNAITDYIPTLCRILIAQISGGCARSDIDYFSNVLWRIVFKYQGLARPYLTDALAHLGPESTAQGHAPSSQEKDRFLASICAARGQRDAAVRVSRSFWVKCRGAAFEYVE